MKTSLDTIMQRVQSQGVKVIRPLETFNDSNGELQLAQIVSPDSDLVHTLVDRSKYSIGFLPGFHQGDFLPKVTEWNSKLTNVDHIAVACNVGQAEAHLKWYSDCLNFERFFCSDDEMTEGLEVLGDENDQEEGGLRTLVATSSSEKYSFKLVFVEPIDGIRKNQVHERHNGPGVQHIAFHSEDIFHSVKQMKKNKTEFISVPTSYYDTIFTQWKVLYDRRDEMEELGILIDVSEVTEDQPNFILQTFTAPIFDRPTLFTEIISRSGSNGFGRKTIRTLFEAVEKLRNMRDTLVVD